jgi:hypothetical protein
MKELKPTPLLFLFISNRFATIFAIEVGRVSL